jgi:hypothetical protein
MPCQYQKAPTFLRTYSSTFTTSLQLVGNHGIYYELAHCISTLTAFGVTKLGRPDTLDRTNCHVKPAHAGENDYMRNSLKKDQLCIYTRHGFDRAL